MALVEIQLSETAHKEELSSSVKAYQTIKCKFSLSPKMTIYTIYFNVLCFLFSSVGMIALKRKLKRIRENKGETT